MTNTNTNTLFPNTLNETYSSSRVEEETSTKDESGDNGLLVETSSCLKNSRINGGGVSPKRTPHGTDVKRITFDESCKKESLDDNYSGGQTGTGQQQGSSVLRPPTPVRPGYGMRFLEPPDNTTNSNYLSAHLCADIRRHSSHTTSSTIREYDKEKDRRYSGYTSSNHLSLNPERSSSNRFLSSSPAASRRISYGSLFKVYL